MLVVVGVIVGAVLGFAIGIATAELVACTVAGAERCRDARSLFSFLGVPFGAVAGALVVVLVLQRRAH